MTVENYLEEKYSATRFPFFPVVEILNKFKEDGRNQLNELHKAGKIAKRKGLNSDLIELTNGNNRIIFDQKRA